MVLLAASRPVDHSRYIQLALAATISSASNLKDREKAGTLKFCADVTFSSALQALFDHRQPIASQSLCWMRSLLPHPIYHL